MSIQNSQQISDIKTMLVKGMNGEGIESIEKTATEGFIDTYTITYTDGTKTTFDVTNGNWGIWTSAVTAAVSATSVAINNDAIGATSILEVYSQNASGTVITVNDIDVTPGTAVLSFPALAEATDFILHIVNGTASGGGGGGGGTTDYLDLSNKPQINGNTLTGNKLSGDLGIPNIFQGTIAEWNQLSTAEKKAYDHASIPDSIDGGVTFPANKVVMTGGGNVEDAIDEVTSGLTNVGTYSTTPVKIGNWLGHDIYRKVVYLGALPNTTLLDVVSGLTNEVIVNIYGIAFEANNTYTLPLPFISAAQGDLIEIGYNNASHAIRVTSTMDVSSFNGYAVLEYYTAG